MITLTRILCPVDFSEATRAGLIPAYSLGERFTAEIVVLHAIDSPFPDFVAGEEDFDLEGYYRAVEDEAERRFDQIMDEESHRRVLFRWLPVRGRPARAIVRTAAEQRADLIVMPTRGRPSAESMLPGSVTERVVRHAPCPVLSIHPQRGEAPEFEPRQVMFATDFSDHAAAALPWAFAIANVYGSDVLLTHVVTAAHAGDREKRSPQFAPVPADIEQEVMGAAWQRLDAAREAASGHGPIETLVTVGTDPAREIVRTAEERDIGLVIMATRGHNVPAQESLGSTAARVVRSCRRPVLTVRASEHRRPASPTDNARDQISASNP